MYLPYLLHVGLLVAIVGATIPDGRPDKSKRTFTSATIDSLIEYLTPLFIDGNMATLFSNTLPNTLDTTVSYAGRSLTVGDDELDSFVITGDISAM